MLMAMSFITDRPIAPGTRIGHVHLKVSDLERSLQFYCGVLGFNSRNGTAGAPHSFQQAVIIITSG